MGTFERGNLGFVSQRQPDVVQSAEEAFAAKFVDGERDLQSVLVGDGAGMQVGGQPIAGMLGDAIEQVLDLRFFEPDRQHAVFEAVVVEDIGEAGSDQHAESMVLERPGSMLPARPATEVAPRQKHARAAKVRPVQLKLGVVGSIFVEPPIEEEELPKAGPLNAFEELLGDDLIGIDIGPVHGEDEAGVGGEWVHGATKLGW